MIADKITHGSFQAAETEVVVRFMEERTRKVKGSGIPLRGQPVDDGAGDRDAGVRP